MQLAIADWRLQIGEAGWSNPAGFFHKGDRRRNVAKMAAVRGGDLAKPSRIRGLATIALLKTHFDQKRDHVSMFEPFLLDVICASPDDRFTADELRAEFHARHGLAVPPHAFNILLTRAARRGYVKRDAGLYVRQSTTIPNPGIAKAKADIESEHSRIASALRLFAGAKNWHIPSDDEALTLLLAFLEENQFVLLLDEPGSFQLIPPSTLTPKDAALVASFLTKECLPSADLAPILNRMLEGFVHQNALLLRDVGSVARQFADLTVFFDTRFLFAALGLHGSVAQRAAREDIDLLRTTGARLAVFDKTLAEMRRVLSVYESKLGSSSGVRQLFPGLLTTYFVGQHYSPSDVREVMALLDTNIEALGLSIRTLPRHNPKYTLDEADLARRIAGPQGESEPRVIHDVDAVAAVLTLRAGQRSDSWERAHAVFCTTTGGLVVQAVQWYRQSGEKGVPPVINQFALSSLAWLKRPAAAQTLKLHELVALCSAALRPTRATWDAFLTHLQRLEKAGTITSDESIAIVANELTQALLLDAELSPDVETPDPDLLSEVVERVRSDYRAEADATVATAREEAQGHVAAAQSDARSKIEQAQAELGTERESMRQLELRLEGRATHLAKIAAWIGTAIGALAIVIGSALSYMGITGSGTQWQILVSGLVGLVAVASVWNLLFGGSILDLQRWIQQKLRPKIRKMLFD